ncbi:MAG: diadenylate cyclase CdaA [Kiritimatiellaeota bacterium]|nr:diadenylate cyclase CdaA [Kiritimatiellota bacterium]
MTEQIIKWVGIACQIAILAIPLYYLLRYLRQTSGFRILVGVTLSVLVLHFVAKWLRFYEVGWALGLFARHLPIAFVVVFQAELRRFFTDVGAKKTVRDSEKSRDSATEIVNAVIALSGMRIGALIALERDVNLADYARNGRRLNAPVNAELIATIFYPNTPLHDGGMVVRNGEIHAASCSFPLTSAFNRTRLPFGQRHRAAIGLSEETDAIVIIVSEETGLVSIAYKGELVRGVSRAALAKIVGITFASAGQSAAERTFRDIKQNNAALGEVDKVAEAMTKLKENE